MVKGTYSDGKVSLCVETTLSLNDENQIRLERLPQHAIAFKSLSISPRVGNTTRYVNFPNGAQFETTDNDGIDRIIHLAGNGRSHNFIHRLENSKRLVFAALVVVVIFAGSFIQFGIPYFSKQIAFMVSDEQARMLGNGVLDSLDGRLTHPSELPLARQQALKKTFTSLLESMNISGIRLVFRKSHLIGANALALPDGTILFTDEIIMLAQDEPEIISIMLHEIGHLQYRHSLRRVIQGFSLAIFVATITGDIATSSTLITGLPVILVESGYSRDMETEADIFALQAMLKLNIDPAFFATMMEKLRASGTAHYMECRQGDKSVSECLRNTLAETRSTKENDTNISRYFASHPLTQERIERFRNALNN